MFSDGTEMAESEWLQDDEEKNSGDVCTLNSLRLYKELNLIGGLLRVGDEIVAFTIGEAVNDDTFVVHIEKSLCGY